MRNLLFYILACIVFGYLAVLYRSDAFLVLFLTAVFLPPCSIFMLWSGRKHLTCSLTLSSYPDEAGKYQACLEATNNSKFYLAELRAKVALKNLGSGRNCKVKLSGKAGAGQQVKLSGKAKELEFGMWQAECRSITCYDCFGLFHVKKKIMLSQQALILPACHETNVRAGIRTKISFSDGEWHHPQIGGNDPSETLKVREYREGDRMNRIHWKLSARTDELLVAELSMPIGCNVVFFLNARAGAMGKQAGRAYWEAVHTISQGLLEEECCHFLVLREGGKLQRKAIRDVEGLAEFWGRISIGRMERGAFQEEYRQEFPGEPYVSAIEWNQELELYCNGSLQAKVSPGRVKEQLSGLMLDV